MRDYGKVHTGFWSSATIRALSDDGKMLALYLLTSPHSTITGVFRLPDGYVCEDIDWSIERVSEGFAELFRNGFANRCETTKFVWILKYLKFNPLENPNQRKSASKIASTIPANCTWKPEFMRVCTHILGADNINPSETLSKPFLNQEQEQEQEQELRGLQEAPDHKVKKSSKPKPEIPDPPDGLDLEAWNQWIDYRTQIRKPIKQVSIPAAQRELAGFGCDQAAVVEQSIANGYQGLFALKSRPAKPPSADNSIFDGCLPCG